MIIYTSLIRGHGLVVNVLLQELSGVRFPLRWSPNFLIFFGFYSCSVCFRFKNPSALLNQQRIDLFLFACMLEILSIAPSSLVMVVVVRKVRLEIHVLDHQPSPNRGTSPNPINQFPDHLPSRPLRKQSRDRPTDHDEPDTILQKIKVEKKKQKARIDRGRTYENLRLGLQPQEILHLIP